jgi:hypothetical protein
MNGEATYGIRTVRWLWHLARLPVVALLVILEPVVAFACGALALLGVLATLLFWSISVPHFPAFTMLMISLSFVAVLVLYEGLIRLLSS